MTEEERGSVEVGGRREVGVVEWEVGDCATISAQWRPLEGDDFLAANEFSLFFFFCHFLLLFFARFDAKAVAVCVCVWSGGGGGGV